MPGYLAFCDKYSDEAACIQALAGLKWPDGFTCDKCQGRKAYHLASRHRLFECAACGHQHSITAGTIFHKTRTPLRKWFVAAYLIAHDKRGVSALYVSRELIIRYDTAWLMCHKIRHALTESTTAFLLDDYVEVDEAFYGGPKRKAIMVCAVQKVSTAGTRNKGINKQGFIAAGARIAVLPNATAEQLGSFIRSNIKAGTTIISDGFNMPIVHRLFSNVKTWLNGTYHGVSTKHLPRYLREWSYRFNRRGRIGQLDVFVLSRAVMRTTITYDQLVAGRMVEGAS